MLVLSVLVIDIIEANPPPLTIFKAHWSNPKRLLGPLIFTEDLDYSLRSAAFLLPAVLLTSIGLFDDIKNLSECEPIVKLIVEWCIDDNGINVLYKNNGLERYPDFKLYKMISRCVHNHTPAAQLERAEFSKFVCQKNSIAKNEQIINIDDLPSYIS